MNTWFINNVLKENPENVTFALLKPGSSLSFSKNIDMDLLKAMIENFIVDLSKQDDLEIINIEYRTLSKDDVKALYWSHVHKDFYPNLEEYMISGPSVLLALKSKDIVFSWRNELMPIIREQYRKPKAPTCENVCHGSDCVDNSFRELLYFFGRN